MRSRRRSIYSLYSSAPCLRLPRSAGTRGGTASCSVYGSAHLRSAILAYQAPELGTPRPPWPSLHRPGAWPRHGRRPDRRLALSARSTPHRSTANTPPPHGPRNPALNRLGSKGPWRIRYLTSRKCSRPSTSIPVIWQRCSTHWRLRGSPPGQVCGQNVVLELPLRQHQLPPS